MVLKGSPVDSFISSLPSLLLSPRMTEPKGLALPGLTQRRIPGRERGLLAASESSSHRVEGSTHGLWLSLSFSDSISIPSVNISLQMEQQEAMDIICFARLQFSLLIYFLDLNSIN